MSWRRPRLRADPGGRRPPQAYRAIPAAPAIPRKRKTRPCLRARWRPSPWRRIARPTVRAWRGSVQSPACKVAYAVGNLATRWRLSLIAQAFRGDHSGDAGEIVGDAHVGPVRGVQ